MLQRQLSLDGGEGAVEEGLQKERCRLLVVVSLEQVLPVSASYGGQKEKNPPHDLL